MDFFPHYQRIVHELDHWGEGVPRRPAPTRAQRLKQFRAFLTTVGDPHRGLNIVHITGTSGKGSTANLVYRMLIADGRPSGLYSSPHPTTLIERYAGPDGKLIPVKDFITISQRALRIAKKFRSTTGAPLGYLELILAIGFIFYKQSGCEWLVLEVGMGGFRDLTYVIPPPAIAVITSIGDDHAHLIGPTLKHIAIEKSGVIKRGSHVFTGVTQAPLRTILKKRTHAVRAHWHPFGGSINTSLASAVGNYLQISKPVQKKVITRARLPCRFEIIQQHPRVILDGAHNSLSIRLLKRRLQDTPKRKLHFIVAVAEHKNVRLMLKALPSAASLTLTAFSNSGRRSYDPQWVREQLIAIGRSDDFTTISIQQNPKRAFSIALTNAAKSDTIVVTGSLLLTGQLRTHWVSERSILNHRDSFLHTH